jgi:hypothetical protein
VQSSNSSGFAWWPLASSLIALGIGYWLRGHEVRRTEILARVDDAVKEIAAAVTAGQKYWSRDASPDTDDEDLGLQSEIVGRLHTVNLLVADIANSLPEDENDRLGARLTLLRQTLTGGNSGKADRRAEGIRLQAAFTESASFTVALRSAGRRFLLGKPGRMVRGLVHLGGSYLKDHVPWLAQRIDILSTKCRWLERQ